MDVYCNETLLALVPVFGQAGTAADPRANTLNLILPMVLMAVIFYFLMIRPQQKRAKEHTNLLKTVRPGDKVETSSGIVGMVVSVKEKTVAIRSGDAKLEISKAAISAITERGSEASSS